VSIIYLFHGEDGTVPRHDVLVWRCHGNNCFRCLRTSSPGSSVPAYWPTGRA